MLTPLSDALRGFCHWSRRVQSWDPHTIVAGDDERIAGRHWAAAMQVGLFCSALVTELEARFPTCARAYSETA